MKNSIEAGLPAKTADRRISRTLLDCMKRLFSGYEKQKKSLYSSLSFSHYLFINSPIHYLAKPIQFGETTAFARLYRFCQIVSLLPNRMRFCQKVSLSPNCIRLSPKGLYFLAKNPRTQVHPLPNVKLPLKTQENNVTFRPMYCQECRIYGLCEVSATLSTEN